jgi:AAA family ATP:ADP antiporter
MLFLTGNVIRVFGWGVTALITPVVLLVTGAGFFGLLIFSDFFSGIIFNAGTTALAAAVFIGTIQNVMSKASKYSLFDPTKEMTYIPLDQESKVKGKAAIDVVGARLGKAGGSVIQQGLFMIGPLATITPYIAATLFVIIIAWIYATTRLNEVFKKQVVLTEATA